MLLGAPRGWLILCLLGLAGGALAEEVVPVASVEAKLPNPLTLEYALSLADQPHPDILQPQAQLDFAAAALLEARAKTGLQTYVDLTARAVDPTLRPGHNWVDDSRSNFFITKTLFDFGHSRNARKAAKARVDGEAKRYFNARQRRRIAIMESFFNVILADLRFAADNERMAYRYVRFDRSRDLRDVGKLSEVDVKELENRFEKVLIKRIKSEKEQTASRFRLAATLGRILDVPQDVEPPQLKQLDRSAPDYDVVIAKALKLNPELIAMGKEVKAAELAVKSVKARRLPVVSAEFEAAEYARSTGGSRDDLRASLNLRIPLYQGGEVRAALARAKAHLKDRRAALVRVTTGLRLVTLDLVQEIETLQRARKAALVQMDYVDMNLDRRQAEYELEIQTTLGDAMTRLSETELIATQIDYDLVLAWARLDALTGQLIPDHTEQTP